MAESDLIRGNVDTVILKVLYEGDRYGYDLIKQINAKSDGQWEIKQPTVYACLKRLEKQGFVSSYWDSSESDGGRRKYYSLTDSGREVFLQYKNEFERANALFGGIIMGSEPVFMQSPDDYSDVEDEGYSVPKRRPAKRVRKETTAKQNVPPAIAEEEQQPEPAAPPEASVYIQQDLFAYENRHAEKQAEPVRENQPQEPLSARAAVDPRSIIDKFYAQEHGESYSDVHGKTVYEESELAKLSPAPSPVKTSSAVPAPVKETPPPAPIPDKQTATTTEPKPCSEALAPLFVEESPARREYKTVLSDLVERFEIAPPDVRSNSGPSRAASEQAAAEEAEREEGRFYKVKQAASERGNDLTIRDHNDSAKEYTHKYYYYGNKLMMTHYTIMCSLMFVIGLILFLTFYSGLHMRMQYDYLLYIGAGLLPIFMFIIAVIQFASDPDKVKRVNVNFRLSMIIRSVIMLQVAVVVYCVNLIWGMPVSFSATHLPALIIPLTYALFIPLSEVIFMTLLKSEHYAVE